MVRPAAAEAAPMAKARRLRLTCVSIVMASHSLAGGALDSEHNALLAAAAAEVGIHLLADLGLGRIGFVGQERGRLHDHAVGAVAALQRLLSDEGRLHGMRL